MSSSAGCRAGPIGCPPPNRPGAARTRATRLFLVLWLVVSVANLLFGVLSAGYGWDEEAMVWLLVFGVPAAFALITQRFRVRG